MPVIDVPLSNLDNESELMDWLASELVANYHFVERRRLGDTVNNDLILVLERGITTTFYGDHYITLLLHKGANVESSSNKGFRFNVGYGSYEDVFWSNDAATVGLDFSPFGVNDPPIEDNQEVGLLSAPASWEDGTGRPQWSLGGFNAGQYLRFTVSDDLYGITSTNGTINLPDPQTDESALQISASGGSPDYHGRGLGTTFAGEDDGSYQVVEERSAYNDLPTMMPGVFSGSAWDSCMDRMDTGPYVRGRLITSVDADSATPENPLHFILVVETDPGIYRQMSFGEVVKLVPFTGGLYASGCIYQADQDIDTSHIPWAQGVLRTNYNENLNQGASPGAVWSSDWSGFATLDDTNGYGWLLLGAGGAGPFSSPQRPYTATIMPYYEGNGAELIGYSPSGFSGQSERWPLTVFGVYNLADYNAGQPEIAPMAVIPDVFLADITNVDAYSVFQDDYGEKFMVVPFYTKNGSGAGSSEKWGYLIRNPDLVVTL